MLGCERTGVKLIPYQASWADLFRQEAERLRSALGDRVVRIEHVGSTSIPGVDAKPILDIVVAVRDMAEVAAFEQALKPLGYIHQAENDMPGRLYFVKRLPDSRSTHHLNITELGTECWFTHVAFRDYLREHPEAREEYRTLKIELTRRHPTDRAAYQEGKGTFIRRILVRAGVSIAQQSDVVAVNGARLWTALQGRGIPMVLCHGGPGGYDYLAPIAEMVDDECLVLRYDQRGSGRSEAIPPYTVAAFVDDLEGLREHFGFDQWIVGGHSWGAGLALAYASQHPHRTRAVLYLSGTGIDPRWHDEYQANRLACLSEAERQEFQELTRGVCGIAGDNRVQMQARRRELSRRTDVFDPAYVDNLPAFDEHPTSDEVNRLVGENWDVYMQAPAFRQAVSRLAMPALFIHGAADPRPAYLAKALAYSLTDGRFELIPRAGHYPWVEQPTLVRAAVREFATALT
jgi:proline iminopeptidase